MRIALLTSDDLPARRCAEVLAQGYDLGAIILRTSFPTLPFDTAHTLDDDQRAYEGETWFGGNPPALKDMAPVTEIPDMTDAAAAKAVTAAAPDVVVALHAGTIGPAIRDMMGQRAVVLHGAHPPDFRGDDTHLWAVYHGEEHALECVVQQTAAEANTGALLFIQAPEMPSDMALHELRSTVTETCLQGMRKVLTFFDSGGMMSLTRLQRHGQVYTPMPAVLKDYCLARFGRPDGLT